MVPGSTGTAVDWVPGFHPPSMLTVILLIAGCALLGLGLIGIILLLWASRRAPEGYENERGFHQLSPPPAEAPPETFSPPAFAPGENIISRLAPTR